MKQTKYRFENFSFHDFAGIERHLEAMAQKGWLLDKITAFAWRYRRIEPKKLHFSVTYFSEASEFNPYPTPNQQTFLDYCADAGWNLAAEWAQMQILWSEQENPVPIETDEELRLRSIHKSMKKNFIPSSFLMIGLVILQMVLQFQRLGFNAFRTLSDNSFVVVVILWSLLMVQVVTNLGSYYLWYRRAQKAVAAGETCPTLRSGYRYFFFAILWAVFILFGAWVVDLLFQGSAVLVLVGAAIVGCSFGITFGARRLFKSMELSGKANLVLTLITCVIATVVVTIVVGFFVMKLDIGPHDRAPVEVYTVTAQNGNTFDFALYRDEIPLKLEEFMEIDRSVYSYKATSRQSLLLKMLECEQNAPPLGYDTSDIWYRVLETPFGSVHDFCLEQVLEIRQGEEDELIEEWRPVDFPGCEEITVYQRFYGNDVIYPLTNYIAVDEDSIVVVRFGWETTGEEVAKTLNFLTGLDL